MLKQWVDAENWVEKVVGDGDSPLTEKIWNGDPILFESTHKLLGHFERAVNGARATTDPEQPQPDPLSQPTIDALVSDDVPSQADCVALSDPA